MGGSVGKVISPIARIGGDIATFGTNEIAGNPIGNATSKFTGGGTNIGTGSIYGGRIFGGTSGLFGGSGEDNPYVSGPFSLDPNQYAQDKADINNLGQSQYDQTLGAIDQNATAQNAAASNFFQQSLPNIAENAQASHLYDSTGYGQEVARQQAALASQVAANTSDQKLQALQGLQGMQTGALQRGQSLEDFINQANVSKSIGQMMAPKPPSGKSQFGTVAGGVGALAPFAKLGKAGSAAGAGAGLGAGLGSAAAIAGDALV